MLYEKSKGVGFGSPFSGTERDDSLLIVALISSANYSSFLLELANVNTFNLQRKLTHFPSPKFVQKSPLI